MLNCGVFGVDPGRITWRQYLACLDEHNSRMDPNSSGGGGEITTDIDRLRRFRKARLEAQNDG